MTAYPLTSSTWDEAEHEALRRVIASDRFSMGLEVRAFEEAFATTFGSRHAVMVNSGSSANLLMASALRYRKTAPFQPGDEIIVPAVGWSTSFFPFVQNGMRLRIVDVDLATFNLDPDLVEAAVTPRTRAVLAINILGAPVDFDALGPICERHDLVLLEDNCESMGATWDGRQAGTFGLMGTFSTFYSHHISTMEGGVCITDDEELYHILLSLRAHGWTRNLPRENHVCELEDDPFLEAFRFVLPGYNLRPLEMSGAVGLEQLRKLPALIEGRRKNAGIFVRDFGDQDDWRIQRASEGSSWFGFGLVLDGRLRGARGRVVDALRAADIECRPIVTGNFARNPVMRHIDASVAGRLTAADRIDADGLFVGNHHFDLIDELELLERTLRSVRGTTG